INITTFVQTAQSSYGSQQIAVNGVLGQDYEAFGFMQLTPEAYAEYMFAKQYTYEETGAGGANLQISRTNTDMVTLALGGKAAIPFLLDPGIVMPEIHSWAYYNPIIGKQDTIFSFVDGGGPMTSIFNPSRTGITIGAALTVAVIDKLEVKFNFDYDIEDRFTAYCGYINLRYTF
ncbi:MAG TPA: autotransporter outer membrane beta-barrel domain-containing protein, partial [Gammaproteobacteria bacterium]|nr:autotransporter outer membrane beta-barrel domain-containing protein [Gammaproteobacteria bacterium]